MVGALSWHAVRSGRLDERMTRTEKPMETKPPLPPFTDATARQKVRMAEDAWNTRDPDRVVLVYTTGHGFSCEIVSKSR